MRTAKTVLKMCARACLRICLLALDVKMFFICFVFNETGIDLETKVWNILRNYLIINVF